jgi:hypothetical protein
MTERIRGKLTYANVASTLALALALGGGSVYAAGKIGGGDIRKGAVRSKQIKNRNVKRQDIAGGAVNSRKVSNNSLSGKDIRENTLGLVPLAEEAQTLTGISARVVRFSRPDPSAATQAVNFGGLNILLSCSAGNAEIEISGAATGDSGTVFDSESAATQAFSTGTSQSINTAASTAGLATVRRIDETVTRFDFELRRLANGFSSQNDCFLHGLLLSGQ